MENDSKEKIMEEVKEFTKKILEKFDGLIKSVVIFGSVVRGEFKPESDIDILVIVDDTLKYFDPSELKEIDNEIEKIAKSINEKLSLLQSFTLTEFTDYARRGHPIVYNFLKEGLPVYDAGFFMPWKRLLESGRIPRTREAIENYMEEAPKKITRAKTVKLLILAEDCYYAMLNSAQAVLMFIGLEPPVPSKAYEEVKRYLVEPGILEPEYAEWLKEIIDMRKQIAQKKILEVKGSVVDEWIDKAEKFVDKMFSLLNALELRKKEEILQRTDEIMKKAVEIALKSLHNLPDEAPLDELEKKLGATIFDAFKRDFVDSGKVDKYYIDLWKKIEKLKKEVIDEKKYEKLKSDEVYQLREDVRRLIRELSKTVKSTSQKPSNN